MDSELPWAALSLDEVEVLLGDLPCRWWVAGGWAIDLHIGRQTREHEDTDVVILRSDQGEVQRQLRGWDLKAADPPGSLRPWRDQEILPLGVHDVWCRRSATALWSLQLMIVDVVDDQWLYRRDPRISRPLDELDGPVSRPGRRVLAPEIQLLYKSARPRAKDEADFLTLIDHLDDRQRAWLRATLELTSPGHPWLAGL